VHASRAAGELVVVAVNAGEVSQVIDVPVPAEGLAFVGESFPGWTDAGTDRAPVVRDGRLSLEIPARQGRVLTTRT
jgi:hypothetical protein